VCEKKINYVCKIVYRFDDPRFFPEEISSMVLQYLRKVSESYLGCTVSSVHTDWTRRKVEPQRRNVLSLNWGSGHCDASLLSLEDEVFEVNATAGDNHLGGEDIDNTLIAFFVDECKKRYKLDITQNKRAMRRLRIQCEHAKPMLSSVTRANVELDPLHESVDFVSSITRTKFEELCMHYFHVCLTLISKVLRDGEMSKSDISDVVSIGGSAQILKVRQLIREYFNGKEPCKTMNPDETVAYGAAVQAAILSGEEMGKAGDILLLDVAPLSLGIETTLGVMTKLIRRNKTIHCKATEIFTTYIYHQCNSLIQVYEGESIHKR
ncbi:hsp70, partial [Reticulomyxa filosa]